MADADETKNGEQQEDTKAKSTDEKPSSSGLLPWIIMAVAIVLCAGAGLGLGRLFAGSGTPQTVEPSQQVKSTQAENLKVDGSKAGSQKTSPKIN